MKETRYFRSILLFWLNSLYCLRLSLLKSEICLSFFSQHKFTVYFFQHKFHCLISLYKLLVGVHICPDKRSDLWYCLLPELSVITLDMLPTLYSVCVCCSQTVRVEIYDVLDTIFKHQLSSL